MLNWFLAALCLVVWAGSYLWYFEGDIRGWLSKRYWWQRTLRLLRK